MIKQTPNKKFRRLAQVTLELTASIIGTVLLIGAIAAIFVWLNNNLVYRQERYEEKGFKKKDGRDRQGRERAGRNKAYDYDNGPEVQVDESNLEGSRLNIFNEQE